MADLSQPQAEPAATTSMRRVPTQARGRERVARILENAEALIAEHGSDGLKMSDLAKAAGISIGSLYQYFPDKGAVLHALAERYHQMDIACIAEGLAPAETPDALCAAFSDLMDLYLKLFREEPVMRAVWAGTQADPNLMALELDASRANATVMAQALRRVGSTVPDADLDAAAFMIMHLGEAAVRRAIDVPLDEGTRMIETYKRMALTEMARLCGDAS
jgi:AcrR family transcriptional regulator